MNLSDRFFEILTTPLFRMGETQLTLGIVAQAVLILLGTIVLSRLVRRALKGKVFAAARITSGAQASIARVVHYAILLVGVFVAVEHLGIDLTALAALGAVLMVGIGFGLQNVTSNFISGLILLFERPIQAGDFVEVGGVLGTVTAINARSTTVETPDNVAIIVPNSNFIQENVTNWSYKDTRTRIHMPVGVVHSADIDAVEKCLLDAAASHVEVLKDPEPIVQLREVGDSALTFRLLVWIADPRLQFAIRSDIYAAMIKAFRHNGIVLAYPQRDLHVRGSDAAVRVALERPDSTRTKPSGPDPLE